MVYKTSVYFVTSIHPEVTARSPEDAIEIVRDLVANGSYPASDFIEHLQPVSDYFRETDILNVGLADYAEPLEPPMTMTQFHKELGLINATAEAFNRSGLKPDLEVLWNTVYKPLCDRAKASGILFSHEYGEFNSMVLIGILPELRTGKDGTRIIFDVRPKDNGLKVEV